MGRGLSMVVLANEKGLNTGTFVQVIEPEVELPVVVPSPEKLSQFTPLQCATIT